MLAKSEYAQEPEALRTSRGRQPPGSHDSGFRRKNDFERFRTSLPRQCSCILSATPYNGGARCLNQIIIKRCR